MDEKLYIIDATTPFFIPHPETVINWSKTPYHHLEKNGKVRRKRYKKIRTNFERYIKKVAKIGYTAITFDDLCHLLPYPFYGESLLRKIRKYQKVFAKFFAIAKEHGLRIFVTTDIMFFNDAILEKTKGDKHALLALLVEGLDRFFKEFPAIDGIVFRVGEADGVDVEGDFVSKSVITTAKEGNRFLRTLVPLFEKHNRICIFRTWTVGAHAIGDLMWNEKTYTALFDGVASDHFIISLKYGETDFFRFCDLNEFFFLNDGRQKIIELQARREYEGFGEYPSFIGWEYARFLLQLKNAPNLAGISVWCQTGGWSSFRNFTFLKNTSFWNEINTYVALKIFRFNHSVEEAVAAFAGERKFPAGSVPALLEFLRLSDEVVRELLYDPEFAYENRYFNKVALPPLLHVAWSNVTISPPLILLYTAFVRDQERSVEMGFAALKKIARMRAIADAVDLPYNGAFHYDTFELFALCRDFIYGGSKEGREKKIGHLRAKVLRYEEKYPNGYHFHIHVPQYETPFIFHRFIQLAVRKRKRYRIVDKLLFNPITARIYTLIYRHFRKSFPTFINQQATPMDAILK